MIIRLRPLKILCGSIDIHNLCFKSGIGRMSTVYAGYFCIGYQCLYLCHRHLVRPEKEAGNCKASNQITHVQNETGMISIQVRQEFSHVSTQKIQVPLSTEEALEFLHYIAVLDTVHPELEMIVAGIRIPEKHRISFWDALIIQAALTVGCTRLLSEDLQHGFEIDQLTIENPFL